MGRGTEQFGLGFLEQEENEPMETKAVVQHEEINVENVVSAVHRLLGHYDDPKHVGVVGKIFAERAHVSIGYTFHTYREPTAEDIRRGKSPREPIRVNLPLVEQYQCQNIWKENKDNYSDSILDAPIITTGKKVQTDDVEHTGPIVSKDGWIGDPKMRKVIEPLLDYSDRSDEDDED